MAYHNFNINQYFDGRNSLLLSYLFIQLLILLIIGSLDLIEQSPQFDIPKLVFEFLFYGLSLLILFSILKQWLLHIKYEFLRLSAFYFSMTIFFINALITLLFIHVEYDIFLGLDLLNTFLISIVTSIVFLLLSLVVILTIVVSQIASKLYQDS